MGSTFEEVLGNIIGYNIVGLIFLYSAGIVALIPTVIVTAINRKTGRYRIAIPSSSTPKKYLTRTTSTNSNKPPQYIIECKQETYKVNPYYRKIGNINIRKKIIEITNKFEKLTDTLHTKPNKFSDVHNIIKDTIESCEIVFQLALKSSLNTMSNTNPSFAQSEAEKKIVQALDSIIKKINNKIDNIYVSNSEILQAEIDALEKSLQAKGLLDAD